MRASLVALCALALAAPAAAGRLPAVAPLASIDPAHAKDSDLAAIARAIGDRRIVMLGEASHGDGSTFLAKARLVRFLAEKHGFDVLLFESGLWDLDAAERRMAAGEAAAPVLAEAVFPLWSTSDQFAPLAAFLDRRRAAGRPIAVGGFDLQLTGKGALRLPGELRALGVGAGADRAAFERTADILQALAERKRERLASLDEAQLDADLATMLRALPKDRRAAFWGQALPSLVANLKFQKHVPQMKPTTFDLRERQMASNLEWLAKTYKGRKIIVWAATSHLLRDRTAIDVTEAKEMVPMGAYFSRVPAGKSAYILAFSAHDGTMGSMTRGQQAIGAAPAGSYEAKVSALGHDAGFVDLSRAPAERRVGRLLGHAPWTGEWKRAVDGLVVIRTMQPTTYPAAAKP